VRRCRGSSVRVPTTARLTIIHSATGIQLGMRLVSVCFLAGVLTACAGLPAGGQDRSGFADAGKAIPSLVVEIRYSDNENFTGRPIDGYEAPVCILTRDTVAALAGVQAKLLEFGLGLKAFDCYRPARAVADFAAWARDPADQKRKADYYPNVDKSRLFELGYIAERSGHSRGSTLDVTLVDVRSGEELDMGGPYDLFDTRSWPSEPDVSPQARANRMLLQDVMVANGFRPLKEEWWHFTLNQEPYPDSYFDFLVR
jgi:zinc D-Ala-D-Ala dipeptidase